MADQTVKKTPKRERRDRTEEILKTATRLFSERGYRGTSLASIAELVGLTEPGLLHYFPSKVKLLEGVLEYREREDQQKYMAMLDPKQPDYSRMMDLLQHLVSENQQKPGLIRLFTVLVAESIRPSHPSHDHFVERYQLARRVYGEVIGILQEEGQIRADADPDQIGILFLAVMDGLQIQWLLDPENIDMSQSFKLFSEVISNFLEP